MSVMSCPSTFHTGICPSLLFVYAFMIILHLTSILVFVMMEKYTALFPSFLVCPFCVGRAASLGMMPSHVKARIETRGQID